VIDRALSAPAAEAVQPAQAVRLTDERILEILGDIDAATNRLPPGLKAFARGLEAEVWAANNLRGE
jgi:hypothetical protein